MPETQNSKLVNSELHEKEKHSIFEIVLASTVHDMKNSLSLLMNQLDSIVVMLSPSEKKLSESNSSENNNKNAVSTVRYEASRLNFSLMQLLTLYKLDKNHLHVAIDEVLVIEFLEDCLAAFAPLSELKNIQLIADCDEELVWFFDKNLTGIAINNVIGNCIRYTRSQVTVRASLIDGMLAFEIHDDGIGYPQVMLDNQGNFIKSIDKSTGSTGLGLFFSSTVAELHHRKNKQGFISLENEKDTGGGLFKLFLP